MKLFGLGWTHPNETYDVRYTHTHVDSRGVLRYQYPRISAHNLAVSLLLLQYDLPPTKPLPWWIVDFNGRMQRFDGFPKTRLFLPVPPITKYRQMGFDARFPCYRGHAPGNCDCLVSKYERGRGEILPPESASYWRIWTQEEIR